MPLVPALCTQCGSKLEIDSAQEAAICPFCKTPFVTEKAINNYNTTNVTNIGNLHADVVNVSEDNSRENRVLSGETFIKLEDYGKAEKVFTELTDDFPHDYRGWWGLIKVNSKNFTDFSIDRVIYNRINDLFEKLRAVADTTSVNEIITIYSTYMNECDEKLSAVEAELNRLSERLQQNNEAEKRENDDLLSQCQNKKNIANEQIEQCNDKIKKIEKFDTGFGSILAVAATIMTIIGVISLKGWDKMGAIVGGPIIFGGIAFGIFGVIHLIIVMPTIASYKNSIKELNDELKTIEMEYDNENNKIKTKYKMERNKIDAEKLKIEEKSSKIVYMKKFICPLCGYVYEGYSAPEKCPVCTCSAEKFKEMEILSFR